MFLLVKLFWTHFGTCQVFWCLFCPLHKKWGYTKNETTQKMRLHKKWGHPCSSGMIWCQFFGATRDSSSIHIWGKNLSKMICSGTIDAVDNCVIWTRLLWICILTLSPPIQYCIILKAIMLKLQWINTTTTTTSMYQGWTDKALETSCIPL